MAIAAWRLGGMVGGSLGGELDPAAGSCRACSVALSAMRANCTASRDEEPLCSGLGSLARASVLLARGLFCLLGVPFF